MYMGGSLKNQQETSQEQVQNLFNKHANILRVFKLIQNMARKVRVGQE